MRPPEQLGSTIMLRQADTPDKHSIEHSHTVGDIKPSTSYVGMLKDFGLQPKCNS